ncbi:minor capsid protein [Oceanobacillus oncorhynchi]|uniref:minor capsid protein n=1 Tax=Oceanobacillus oncorhynchi TaxID=545501 RepID=UPI0025A329CB|nr:minor capsid protein [Oceanobacillus oncorhynchi]MDM8100945.1 minor capsid protein [Oceanobacillus oncorhynchi]
MANNYWRKREQDHIKNQIKNDAEIAKRIRANQDAVLEEIDLLIQAFYSRYAGKEGISMSDARKRIRKTDIERYAKKAKRYVKERNFTPTANEEMRLYNATMRINRLEMLKHDIRLEIISMANEEEKILDEVLTEAARAEYERQSGILGQTVNGNAKTVEAIVYSSFQYATWSERLWSNQDALRLEVERQLNRGIVQGLNPRELARELRKSIDSSISNSERLMRTEMARVQSDVFKDSLDQADFEQYEFISEPDACPICKELDGKIFNTSDMEVGTNMYPMHPNCRCSTAAYMDREAFEKELETKGL